MGKENAALEIYIKHEGGHEVIIRALKHYRKRISTISSSPEIADTGAMFGMILQQEGSRVRPGVDSSINAINDLLSGKIGIVEIRKDLEMCLKALNSYRTDIIKARQSKHDYYLNLVGNLEEAEKDLPLIDISIERLELTN